MMKKISKLLSVMMIAVCVFVLSACGSGSGSAGSKDIHGSYELTAATTVDTGGAASDFDLYKEMGMTATLDIEQDNTGILNMFGTPIAITVDEENKTITVYGDTMEYTFQDSAFSFIWENTKLEFTKTE